MLSVRQGKHDDLQQQAQKVIHGDNQLNQFKMTKEQQLQEIIKVKAQINEATDKRLQIITKQKQTKLNILTLSTLCNEGKKRLQKKEINIKDRDAFNALALLHKDFVKQLGHTMDILTSKKLLKLRLSYASAKTKHVQKLLDNDPHAKGNNLTGLLTRDADEKQLKILAMGMKTSIKALNKQIVDKNRR